MYIFTVTILTFLWTQAKTTRLFEAWAQKREGKKEEKRRRKQEMKKKNRNWENDTVLGAGKVVGGGWGEVGRTIGHMEVVMWYA